MSMSWTDERIDRLKEMWSQGMTASHIADELGGVSRNAVIGKAHRLGLQSRPSPVKPNEPAPKAKAKPREKAEAALARPSPGARPPSADEPPFETDEAEAEAPKAAAPASAEAPRRPRRPSRWSARSARAASSARGRATSRRRSRRRRRAASSRPSRAPRSPTRPACSTSTRRSANGRSAIRASPISISAASRQSGLPLLRRALRGRLSGPAAPPRPQAPAAAAVRRAAGPVKPSRK